MGNRQKFLTSHLRFDPPHCFRVWFQGDEAVLIDAGSPREAKEEAERRVKAKVVKVEDLSRGRLD